MQKNSGMKLWVFQLKTKLKGREIRWAPTFVFVIEKLNCVKTYITDLQHIQGILEEL